MRTQHSIPFLLAASAALLILAGGCPNTGNGGNGNGNDNGNGDIGDVQTDGTWTGTLSCTRTQSAGGATTPPVQSTINDFELVVGEDGAPTAITIPGYTDTPSAAAELARFGDTVTINVSATNRNVTLTANVTSSLITATSIDLTVEIEYLSQSTNNNLRQEGTATLTLNIDYAADELTYRAEIVYDVQLIVSGLDPINTGETTTCEGTLTRS